MSALEAVESYSAFHSESFDELLEWPYRRFMKAFDAWQKRRAIDEIEKKKNMHIMTQYTIIEWKDSSDQTKAIENIENYYELLKDLVWEQSTEKQQKTEELEQNDPFLQAGKRNMMKVEVPEMPGESEIEGLPEL